MVQQTKSNWTAIAAIVISGLGLLYMLGSNMINKSDDKERRIIILEQKMINAETTLNEIKSNTEKQNEKVDKIYNAIIGGNR